jgi:hypothetical protein
MQLLQTIITVFTFTASALSKTVAEPTASAPTANLLQQNLLIPQAVLELAEEMAATTVSVLGIGIPANAPAVPWVARWPLQRSLDAMESSMQSSQYDWKMLYITPEENFDAVVTTLREKKWDIVMVGRKSYSYFYLVRAMLTESQEVYAQSTPWYLSSSASLIL